MPEFNPFTERQTISVHVLGHHLRYRWHTPSTLVVIFRSTSVSCTADPGAKVFQITWTLVYV
jgi:hypothetical protein